MARLELRNLFHSYEMSAAMEKGVSPSKMEGSRDLPWRNVI